MKPIAAAVLCAVLLAAPARGSAADAGPDTGEAGYRAAMELLQGSNGAPDRAQAVRLLTEAAARHFARAEYQLALLEADPAKAAAWLHDAADHGDPDAVARLGAAYLHGRGVAADAEKAATLFQRAASRGQPDALYALATLRLAAAAPGEERGRACGYLKAAEERGVAVDAGLGRTCADLTPEEGRWARTVARHVPLLRR